MFYLRRVAVENDPYRDSPSTLTEEGGEGSGEAGSSGGKGGRKSLFKKKGTSTSISSVLKKTSSVSSIIEDQPEVSTKSFCCLAQFLPDILYQLHSQTLHMFPIFIFVIPINQSPPSCGRKRHHRSGSGRRYKRTTRKVVRLG